MVSTIRHTETPFPYNMYLLCCSSRKFLVELQYEAVNSGVNLVRSLGVVNQVAEIFDWSRKKIPSFRKNFRFSRQKIL